MADEKVQTTREQREAAVMVVLRRPATGEAWTAWVDSGQWPASLLKSDVERLVQRIATAIASHTAAEVERERERAESLLALGAELARCLGSIAENAISPMFAAEEAISDWDRFIAGETIRSRPPRAGAEKE